MSNAKNTAGVVGQFGSTSFISVRDLAGPRPQGAPRSNKFFRSRHLNDVEEEEEEEEEEQLQNAKTSEIECSSSSLNSDSTSDIGSSSVDATNIKIAVRVRPTLQDEEEEEPAMHIDKDQIVVGKNVFRFDQVWDGISSQENIYGALIQPIVTKVLSNYSASVFAYGQTGTGKSFTMGTKNGRQDLQNKNRGIITRALQQIFEESSANLTLKISFYEILNSQVFDLINPGGQKVPLVVREVPKTGLFRIPQLEETEVCSVENALEILQKGCLNRSTAATGMNAESSRSHAVCTFTLITADETGRTVTRKLNLVDLAGSESVNELNETSGQRVEEAKNINSDLLELGNVIRALVSKQTHIPYRNSVLTKVLKECLQANCFVSMITCVSPRTADLIKTVTTLRFAHRAKTLDVRPVPAHLQLTAFGSAVKKKPDLLIRGTPGNNTIHTPTPSRRAPGSAHSLKRSLNRTIGTPGKRARGEFATPLSSSLSRPGMTSTLMKSRVGALSAQPADAKRRADNVEDLLSITNLSMIAPPGAEADKSEEASNMTDLHKTHLQQEIRQELSVMLMPAVREAAREMAREVADIVRRENFRHLIGNAERRSPRLNKPRQTSSPIRKSANTTNTETADMSEDSSLEYQTTILVAGEADSPTQNIISGARHALPFANLGNRQRSAANESSSPELGTGRHRQPAVIISPPLPSVEEMERSLGINPESPGGFLFSAPAKPYQPAERSFRRSVRRTTMIGPELEKTLSFIRSQADTSRRKSVRLADRPVRQATDGIFYGSPSDKENLLPTQNLTDESRGCHPLQQRTNWSVDPLKQQEHNRNILLLLNTGNLKVLTALPAIGPKTGLIIHSYRELHQGIQSIQELENIRGLSKGFYKRFLKENHIDVSG